MTKIERGNRNENGIERISCEQQIANLIVLNIYNLAQNRLELVHSMCSIYYDLLVIIWTILDIKNVKMELLTTHEEQRVLNGYYNEYCKIPSPSSEKLMLEKKISDELSQ